MAPRRNNSSPSAIDNVHNLVGLELDGSIGGGGGCGGGIAMEHFPNLQIKLNSKLVRCCVPTGDCFKLNALDYGLIQTNNLSDCVRVICSNERCTAGQYMHRECFDAWEDGVLTYLKSIGRARSWSERQRQQNLWTKKGYDLVFKACGCKCGRGYLKKDLDWQQQMATAAVAADHNQRNNSNNTATLIIDDDATKKKKKRNRSNQKSALIVASNGLSNNNNNNHTNNNNNNNNNSVTNNNNISNHINKNDNNGINVTSLLDSSSISNAFNASICVENRQMILNGGGGGCGGIGIGRHRTNSLSSSLDDCFSPLASTNSDSICSPIEMIRKEKSKVEAYSERIRSTSGCNGIFSRRLDFSIFNMLPKTRLNSYQIKMEDEGNHGNDETRLFILSSLAQHHKSRINCVLCEDSMLVFDRYPLVDGTFFLSPKRHTSDCIEVKYEGQTQYLTALCMGCLEGVSNDRIIHCRFCSQKWNGSSLVLGTMYAYDIFAAMPCCPDRLTCNSCFKLLLYPHQRLNFFSDYSHVVSCIHCTAQDTHFVKPLSYCYVRQSAHTLNQWP